MKYLTLLALVGWGSLALQADCSAEVAGLSEHSLAEKSTAQLGRSDWNGILAAHQKWEYAFRENAEGWLAVNSSQNWQTHFQGGEFLLKPNGSAWTWGMQLMSVGYGDQCTYFSMSPVAQVDENRLTYLWSSEVHEWYINDARGIEHGFSIRERPEGFGHGLPLKISMQILGDLSMNVVQDGQLVRFCNEQGASELTYSSLKVWDADGRILRSHFQKISDENFAICIDDAVARYPLTIDPLVQQAYLKASNPGALDDFGCAVAMSGNTVVVGAMFESSSTTGVNSRPNESGTWSGAACVFVNQGGQWVQQAYLKPSNSDVSAEFGTSVAISGDTIVVGSPFEYGNAKGVNGVNTGVMRHSGAAYVFVRNGNTWSQQAYLKASNTSEYSNFGSAVAISGNVIAVGAPQESSHASGVNGTSQGELLASGAGYVFVRSGTQWQQQAFLKAKHPQMGDNFGCSVAAYGDRIVIGALGENSGVREEDGLPDDSLINSGAAYVFSLSEGNWLQEAYLKATHMGAEHRFGSSVAIWGDRIICGAPRETSDSVGINSSPVFRTTESGAAYIFFFDGMSWEPEAYVKPGHVKGGGMRFGTSVALSESIAVVGAPYESSSTQSINGAANVLADSSGAAFVFVRSADSWVQQGFIKAFNAESGDFFGASVATAGDTVIAGAPNEDGSSAGVNGLQNNLLSSSGASYTFTGFGPAKIALSSPQTTVLPEVGARVEWQPVIEGRQKELIVTVRNTGADPLNLYSAQLMGGDVADFVVMPLTQTLLREGESAPISVIFSPSGVGHKTTTLTISSSDPATKVRSIALQGIGSSSEIPGASRVRPIWSRVATPEPLAISSPRSWNADCVGTYHGIIHDADGSLIGALKSVKVTTKGTFSGQLYHLGKVIKLKGSIVSGQFVQTLPGGSVLRIACGQWFEDVVLSFVIEGNGSEARGMGFREALNGSMMSSLPQGTYVAVIVPNRDGESEGQPMGFGSLVFVSKAASSVYGVKEILADGAKTTGILTSSVDGVLPLFLTVGTNASIGGNLLVRDILETSDFDGIIQWNKSPATKGNYVSGFSSANHLIGSKHMATGSALVVSREAGIADALLRMAFSDTEEEAIGLLWDSSNRITRFDGITKSSKMTYKATDGTLSASVLTEKFGVRNLWGVVFQKQNQVFGTHGFKLDPKTNWFSISPWID